MTLLRLLVASIAALLALPAGAEDTALLIQLRPDGRYTVWHAGDASPLGENEILSLEAAATPEGSRRVMTAAGFAQAFDTPNGILISLPGLGPERAVLIDRDGCGGIKLWHSHGNINPSEDELTDLVLAALPEGGKRIALGKLSAKAYSTKIGVIAVIWKPVAKPVR